ncbi:transmembrane channel-like protein 6 [Myxocyprinus asiaticus]|uniref:transmembrane channel-like protein 6 n=1 Tax=Myxocyprinus asiaticus TaxID=70543 RepID=UPI00222162AC|nr:transmembrane channel-like protein 6 [Myxocyprinus asiaticus]XP_051570298.1 transmembrane channel-like protein 6 [Myxocyprinus asiaticus]
MTTALIMETIPSGDGAQDVIELEAVRIPHRGVRFDLTHENQEDLIEEQSYQETNQTDALLRNHWSTSTQRVLSSLPSRSIGWSQTAVLSQHRRRSTQRRRRRPYSTVSTTPCTTEQDTFIGLEVCSIDVTGIEEFLKNLQGLSAGECVRLLREMPLTVSEKRQLRALASHGESGQSLSANRALCYHQFQARVLKGLCGGWLGRLQLGQGVLKSISARFGTGVLSYFIFLRTLLHYNILLFLINSLFLLLPQITNPPRSEARNTAAHTDLWLLTGMGVLTDSGMFYGYYSNFTSGNCRAENKICPENYNIPLAYIFTIGIGLFVTCVMLVHSMSKSFGKSFHIFKSNGYLALKVFCSWDFKMSRTRSVKLQSVNICTQLKEMLSDLSCSKQKRNVRSTLGWLAIRALVWSICLLSIAMCLLTVNHIHQNIDLKVDSVNLLLMPLVVSCISHLLPGFFNILSRAEHYESPNVHIYVSIIRNLLLKGCILILLCSHWLRMIAAQQEAQNKQCWETFVGQELYRLVLMDLIFAMLYIVFGEFLWGLCTQNMSLRRRKLVFDISRNVLELIYGQMLVWLGVLFAPMLPAVQTGKLFLLFYMKKTSLVTNFQAPRKHWRATQMSTLFITLLFFPSFIGPLACVIYTVWRIEPSPECGPLRNLYNILLSGEQWIRVLENSNSSMAWLSWAYTNLVDNPLFLFIITGLLLIFIYIHTHVLDGQKKVISKLQEQINNEGEDKKFLIAKLQALNEQGGHVL